MSETPLCDAEVWTIAENIISDKVEYCVTADFARTLETKLRRYEQAVQAYLTAQGTYGWEMSDEIEAQLRAALKDQP